ncbi:6_t:CDS:2 [Entrophospora sp. SA101]|nr:6_t:CDS:2 [Entrophospora sp. SA101]
MSESVLGSSARQRLESFLLLSKSAKGSACVQLIKDALGAPGVYVFAELLDMPNIAKDSRQLDFTINLTDFSCLCLIASKQ